MPSPLPRATRRTALGGTLAAVLTASGCTLTSSDGDDAPAPTGSTAPSPGAPAATQTGAGTDADTDLVAGVLQQLSIAHRVVRENRRTHPALNDRLRTLERLHATHARELGDLAPVTGRAADASESRAAALARVATAETRLQTRLVRAAGAAESGALAQLLASMAAAVAQERTQL